MFENIPSLIISGIFIGSIYSLVAVGLSILFGVGTTVNLAHGDFMILGAYITFFLYTSTNVSPLLALIIIPLLMAGLGALLYKKVGFSNIATRPMERGEKEFLTLLLTFAFIWIVSNAIAFAFTPNYQSYTYLQQALVIAGIRVPLSKLVTIIISFSVIVGLWLIIKKTWFGMGIRCVYDDWVASKLMGINVDKVYLFVFMIAFATAGVAGTLYSMNYILTPYLGVNFTMVAFVATILGGIGSIRGALVGGISIGLLESFAMSFLSPLLRISVIFTLFILVLLTKPKGLFRGP